jgi:UDP-N-acetyl-D-mannosaminuronic acid transferase (WecB/TagA/CpsF family)
MRHDQERRPCQDSAAVIYLFDVSGGARMRSPDMQRCMRAAWFWSMLNRAVGGA